MCGIVGAWDVRGKRVSVSTVELACTQIRHRGPDDSGIWQDQASGVVLGHTRLSILDLSPAGHQPMVSTCGRYVIVLNGEIYNHLDLRRQLEKAGLAPGLSPSGKGRVVWRGHSDTETLLACFVAWGVEKTLKESVGMFALALWDREARKLTLTRDRLGEKPLYYGFVGGALAFASELKALKVLPGFVEEIDRGALALLMRHSYVPAPYCIYRGLFKLPPGTWLEIGETDVRRQSSPVPRTYWSALEVALAGIGNPLSFTSENEAAESLERVISQSIAGQMIADVPLGAFLSGGVDSSTVVALMQAQSGRPVKTFSIGFYEKGYDEARYAKVVAQHLGTEHTELYVTPEQALAVIPRLPGIYNEPFSDSSQIPTFLISQLARQHVTVSLSGDGGDELFGGYNRYFVTDAWWCKVNRIPSWLRQLIPQGIVQIPPDSWDRMGRLVGPLLPIRHRHGNLGYKLHKFAGVMRAESPGALYRYFVSHWSELEAVVLGAFEPVTHLTLSKLPNSSLAEQMMFLDSVSYLPDDILVKVDRAAMAVSLETRVPMLDHRVVEFAWRLPLSMKIRQGQGKWILREVLYKYVPKELVERPKMGFGVPIDSWLRGPLRGWAEALLEEGRLKREGYFNPQPIRQKWSQHLSGTRNWQYHLWDVLMFQAWLESSKA